MHESLMNFLRSNTSDAEVRSKRILDVGSLNINGSAREVFEPFSPSMYLGIDESLGPDVNIQMSGYHLYSIFLPSSFDIVICTEVLEHAEYWKQLVEQLRYVLRPGGLLYLSCRAPGFSYHNHPNDFWRFSLDQIKYIFSDMICLAAEDDTQFPGVFLKVRKTSIPDLDKVEPLRVYEDTNSSTL